MNGSGESGGETGRGHYISVLKKQARLLGDYEQVHFRRRDTGNNSIDGTLPPSHATPQPSKPQTNYVHHTPNHHLQSINITPRRPPRPLYVNFTKNSAALYLRQTQSLWMKPDLSRQEASNILLDRPVGSFLVRNSRHARYALSLRAPETPDEPTIRHFLVQHNNQSYLTIQGSNLPFLSIFDLLAYFCYHQSGGMPCCLRPPQPEVENSMVEGSESSESDSDGDEPPRVPPRTPSMMGLSDIGQTGRTSMDIQRAPKEPVRKKIPPPKPPRPVLLSTDSWEDVELDKSIGEDEGTLKIVVDKTSQVDISQEKPPHPSQNSSPRRTRPSSSDAENNENMSIQLIPRPQNTNTVAEPSDKLPTLQKTSPSSSYTSTNVRHRVVSLIDMFESKSPSTSPTKTMTLHTHRELGRRGLRPDRSNSFGMISRKDRKEKSASSVLLTGPSFDSHQSGSISDNPPVPPPKPKLTTPPLPPRPFSTECGERGVPTVPPRTPAPLLPPKPPGSKPPTTAPRMSHRRSLSDSEPIMSPAHEPPMLPPKVWRKMVSSGYEMMPGFKDRGEESSTGNGDFSLGMSSRIESVPPEAPKEVENEGVTSGGDDGVGVFSGVMLAEVESSTKEWQVGANSTGGGGTIGVTGSEQSSETGKGGKRKKTSKPLEWARKLQFRGKKKPRKRIKKFIIDLAADQGQPFGQKVSSFITDMRARSTEPHQKMMLEVRNFVTGMQDHLLQHHQNDLETLGMESCDNFGHVVECTLQEVIVQPLSHFIYLRIEEYYATNGHLFQLQRSIHQGKLKTADELGIRSHLTLPNDKVISEIATNFDRMMKTACAISKLEYLLEAARITYDNVRDSRQPKKPMTDMGADDFLPVFVWVLIQCGFTRAEIEAEYMWGLAHPNLFNGEGGYYLTTLTSSVNVLKELVVTPQQSPNLTQLPTMNNLQTELKVFFEDEHTGQFSSAYYLPIVPTMTAAEICEIIVDRRKIPNPDAYGLFTVVDGQAAIVPDDAHPQEIKLQWTLQKTLGASKMQQPSSQFFAYKLRTPMPD